MTTAPIDPSTTDAWSALKSHREDVRGISLRDVFDQDAKRGERYVLEAGDLYVDYSKNLITDDTIDLLVQLAEQTGVEATVTCGASRWRTGKPGDTFACEAEDGDGEIQGVVVTVEDDAGAIGWKLR